MTKYEAIEKLGCGSGRKLAKLLGRHPTAVYHWKGNIPELMEYRIEKILREREASKNLNG